MPLQADQMRAQRQQATQRFEIFVPFSFTSIDVGTTPRRLFDSRLGVASLTLQASPENTGRIYVGADSSIRVGYGFGLTPGATANWEITLTDILQVLGWGGLDMPAAADQVRRPLTFNPFRQSRVQIDASQFWVVASAADQDLTIQYSVTPRFLFLPGD